MKPYDPNARENAGFIFLGVPNAQISIPPGHSDWHQQGECTNALANIPVNHQITIFASLFHMHTYGKRYS